MILFRNLIFRRTVCAVFIGYCGFAAAEKPEVAAVEVMVLGVHHFDNPGLDINTPEADDVLTATKQAQIEALVTQLARFKPTRIAVKMTSTEADLHIPSYRHFKQALLKKDRNEITQLGFRLAALLKHANVYGIDENNNPEVDYFPFGAVQIFAEAEQRGAQLQRMMEYGASLTEEFNQQQESSTMIELLNLQNQPDVAEQQQRALYYALMPFSKGKSQPGPDLNAAYYLRNARIFGKLTQIAKPGDRILVIYGGGHRFWFEHFLSLTPGFVSESPLPYLIDKAN